jgi:hypothetical protein
MIIKHVLPSAVFLGGACKGKSIRVAGFPDHFVLWPGQSVELAKVESAWIKTVNPRTLAAELQRYPAYYKHRLNQRLGPTRRL